MLLTLGPKNGMLVPPAALLATAKAGTLRGRERQMQSGVGRWHGKTVRGSRTWHGVRGKRRGAPCQGIKTVVRADLAAQWRGS